MYFFFFNDTATTEIYTLSLHDALPIWPPLVLRALFHEMPVTVVLNHLRSLLDVSNNGPYVPRSGGPCDRTIGERTRLKDRKSTRLNSSHANISYAVFCLKKKKKYLNAT